MESYAPYLTGVSVSVKLTALGLSQDWWGIFHSRVCYCVHFVQTLHPHLNCHTFLLYLQYIYYQIKTCSIRKVSDNKDKGRGSYALNTKTCWQHILAFMTANMQVRNGTWELFYVITSTQPLFSDLLSEDPSNTLYRSFADGLVHTASPLPWEDYSMSFTHKPEEEFIIGYRSLPKIVTHHILISAC